MRKFSGLGRERQRGLLHVRAGRGVKVPEPSRHGPDLPGAPGRRRWLRVLREASARYPILSAELLRRVRQRRGHDER